MATRIQFDFPAVSVRTFRDLPRGETKGGLIAWLRAAAARWRQRRTLEELDERMLRDIGVSRSQAMAEASKPFWRR